MEYGARCLSRELGNADPEDNDDDQVNGEYRVFMLADPTYLIQPSV